MSYVELTDEEIATGKPVANTLTEKIKDNFIDHESRIIGIETGTNIDYPPIILRVNGYYRHLVGLTGTLKTTLNFALRITGVRLIVGSAGSSGTTEIDVLYKRGAGAFTSILSTTPTVSFSAGSDSVSTNAVIDTNEDNLLAGDILRLDILSSQVDTRDFLVRIDYVKE